MNNRFKIKSSLFFFLSCSIVSFSQSKLDLFLTVSDTLNTNRRNAVIITESSIAGLTLIGLGQLWYQDFDRSKFHTINDNDEWLQMDKIGHVFSAYQLSRFCATTLKWSGVSKKNQMIYGSTLGLGFLTAVEVFDGFSKEWGFSWGDIVANTSGTALYLGQELLWDEQRIALKFSFHQTKFANQHPEKLGNGFLEEVIKDYNGQTYWLSANIHSFFKESNFPKLLNIAVGYGADGMLAGLNEVSDGMITNRDRSRQYYLSLDVNLKNIETNSKVLSTFFDVFNTIKIPFPSLEFSKKRCVFHLFYY